jgi:fructokinase
MSTLRQDLAARGLETGVTALKIVVCGEALMDVFATGETAGGLSLDAQIGGSPLNVAVGLARLAQPVAFFGALSRGPLGERLLQALHDEGVDTTPTLHIDAPTTLSLVGTDARGVPSYAFYGQGCADRLLGIEALELLPSVMSAIHVGSYTTVVEPIASTLRTLVEREHLRTLISFDPNVRLKVEPDLARWRDMLQWMLTRTHVLKVSEEDLSLLLPSVRLSSFAEAALAKGVRLVVITRGGDGAQAWTSSASVSLPAVAVSLVDTVGAGDTFQAALLTWLAENRLLSMDGITSMSSAQLCEAMQFSAKAASITCSRRGANLPRRSELSVDLS